MAGEKKQPKPDHTQELLDEALEESFPASDPPSLTEPGGGISGTEEDAKTDGKARPASPTGRRAAEPQDE